MNMKLNMKQRTLLGFFLASMMLLNAALAEDGRAVYRAYREQYGNAMSWDQSVWVRLDGELDAAEATDFETRMLKAAVYSDASAAKLTREEAARIACLAAGAQPEEAISAVLLADGEQLVWKFRVSCAEKDELVEVDAFTGEVLDREVYKADNYAFDHPVKMYTLHSAYAPAAIAEFGLAYMSAVEVSKRFGDMRLDHPMLPLLDDTQYQVWAQERTVTFKALDAGHASYRVRYDEAYRVQSIEEIGGGEKDK